MPRFFAFLAAALMILVPAVNQADEIHTRNKMGEYYSADMSWLREQMGRDLPNADIDIRVCGTYRGTDLKIPKHDHCMVVSVDGKAALMATMYNEILWEIRWIAKEFEMEEYHSEGGLHVVSALWMLLVPDPIAFVTWQKKTDGPPPRDGFAKVYSPISNVGWTDDPEVLGRAGNFAQTACWDHRRMKHEGQFYQSKDTKYVDLNWFTTRSNDDPVYQVSHVTREDGLSVPKQGEYLLADLEALMGTNRCLSQAYGHQAFVFPSRMLPRKSGMPFVGSSKFVPDLDKMDTTRTVTVLESDQPEEQVEREPEPVGVSMANRPGDFTKLKPPPAGVNECTARYAEFTVRVPMQQQDFAPKSYAQEEAAENVCTEYASRYNIPKTTGCYEDARNENGSWYSKVRDDYYCYCVEYVSVDCGVYKDGESTGEYYDPDIDVSHVVLGVINNFSKLLKTLAEAVEFLEDKPGLAPKVDLTGPKRSDTHYVSPSKEADDLYQVGMDAYGRSNPTPAHTTTALQSFYACLEKDPFHVPCHWELGYVHRVQGQKELARLHWKRVKQLDPGHPLVDKNLATVSE